MQNMKSNEDFASHTIALPTIDGYNSHRGNAARLLGSFIFCLACFASASAAAQQVDEFQPTGPGHIVHDKFGGQIFGFDIDANGAEGVLSEAQTLNNGNVLAAVETFDQKTGKILKIVTKTQTQDDDVTMGVVGNSIGLVEHEHVVSFLHVKRSFHILNPLDSNKFTGTWTPPIGPKHIITEVSRTQGSPIVAAYAIDVSGSFTPFVFSSNVAANTFGPIVKITDQDFTSGSDPVLAFNSKTNHAVLGHSTLGNPFGAPQVALVDLTKGNFTKFTGVGTGDVNGIAVDSATGIACTTTEIDFSVQFYDLKHKTGFSETLPGATNQLQSGGDVEFDPVHKLFLVSQSVSSTQANSSAIYVYDEKGNLKETLNGFHFSNTFNVIPSHIALKPNARMGFVDGPDQGVTEVQSFNY
jgi:hypothetical protein